MSKKDIDDIQKAILIDDRKANGANKFKGEHIHFLSSKFPTWKEVLLYLIPK